MLTVSVCAPNGGLCGGDVRVHRLLRDEDLVCLQADIVGHEQDLVSHLPNALGHETDVGRSVSSSSAKREASDPRRTRPAVLHLPSRHWRSSGRPPTAAEPNITLESRRLSSALELQDSRIDHVDISGADAVVHFSHAYIHKSRGTPGRDPGTGWSQEALLIIAGVVTAAPLPSLPNAISDGFLEVGAIKHTLLPLPFKRKVDVKLSLVFTDGAHLDITGQGAVVELLGKAIFLEDT